MKLSTAVKMGDLSSEEKFFAHFARILKTNLEAGFQILDMPFAQYTRNPSPLRQGGWFAWLERLKFTAKEIGVQWGQGHAHFFAGPPTNEDDELMLRSIQGAGLLGVKWLAVHPISVWKDSIYSREESLLANLKMLRKYGEWAKSAGVKLAVENVFGQNFGSYPQDLLELLASLNDPIFGICWDTGHAHLMGLNQKEAPLELGSDVKALHICDNRGRQDEHLLPLEGTISWQP
ncbi:MAG TPA: sugar phosphate isomerase/epimerase, partial [Firmicutes bacterium]|nr:sugar phosphate isomerase/epimerase [Bacillota bacterium]